MRIVGSDISRNLEVHPHFLQRMSPTTPTRKPALWRIGLLPPHDDANLHGLAPLLREHFGFDRQRMTELWAGIAERECCEIGVYTHEIAETKVLLAQHQAIVRGVQAVFYLERLPTTTLVRRR